MRGFKPYQKNVKVDVRKIKEAGKLIYEAMGYKHSKRLGSRYFCNEIMYKIVGNQTRGNIEFIASN